MTTIRATQRRSSRVRFVLRVSLPDEPGALAAVAGALASIGMDIETLDVLERVGGRAVDEFVVRSDQNPDRVREALRAQPDVILESCRSLPRPPEQAASMRLAAELVEHGRGAVGLLVQRVPDAVGATWCLAACRSITGVEQLHRSSAAPGCRGVDLPWLPLEGPRRLDVSDWVPPSWRVPEQATEFAAAPLGPAALLVARIGGPRFRSVELTELGELCRVAVATEVAAAPRPMADALG